MSSIQYEEIVRKCYYDILNRIPDQNGLEHFIHLLKKNKIDEKKLIELLKESEEFKQQNCEITDSPEDKNLVEIIELNFMKILNREPDGNGLKYFFTQIKNNNMNIDDLIQKLKESPEYKLSHPIEIEPNTPVDVRMKKEWNERTKMNPLFVIATDHSESEDDFWNSGIGECNDILGINTERYQKIIENKEPSKMNILEIGCGIGRILIPMRKFFGSVTGIDISSEMVQLGQKYVSDVPNCNIIENNGVDLSEFSDNTFDFCYSFIVFQHIPEKKIVERYISEVSRVLKSDCLFRFQVRGTISTKPNEITTWDGVQFTSNEIHKIAEENNFEIIEEGDDKTEYYWITLKSH
jgi:SAM-dependent methyltransferase